MINKENNNNLTTCAVVVAAGSSNRMGLDKILAPLCNIPVIIHTLIAFEECNMISRIVVVTREESIEKIGELIKAYGLKKVAQVIAGGKNRAQSVYMGVLQAGEDCEFVCIHDGARPLVSQQVIADTLKCAYKFGAATAGVKSKDTIKEENGGFITATLNRENVVCIQTPQAFKREKYLELYDGKEYTDECRFFEFKGEKVAVSAGDYRNIKLTTPEDMIVAEALMEKPTAHEEKSMRIGHGYDVHKLEYGCMLVIGGIEIPYERGLFGHSDADVLTHAIIDALLGAAGLGDIGKHFPDNDPKYSGVYSIKLLEQTRKMLFEKGYYVGNIDATIIAQKPKMSEFTGRMRANIATACATSPNNVNIKATTEEGLGFTGREEGISAQAVCIIFGK